MIDAYGSERQFVDHIRPIWEALPAAARGAFYVNPDLPEHAARLGIREAQVAGRKTLPRGGPIIVASWGDHRMALRAGRRLICETQHGIGQSYSGTHSSYPGGDGRLDDPGTLLLCPNGHAARRWRSRYPRATVAVVGSPRLDSLPARDPDDPPVVAVTFHWRATVAPEARSAFDEYAEAVLALAASRPVIGHAHPRIASVLERFYRRARIEYVRHLDDVIRRAAILVADNTSAIYEFAAGGGPVVLLNKRPILARRGYVADPGYRIDVEHGLRFWEASSVGPNVWDPDDLPAAVELALEDPPELQADREAALDVVYAYRSGAAARAAEAVLAWAGAEALVAA